jgi:hypothetical protein
VKQAERCALAIEPVSKWYEAELCIGCRSLTIRKK